MFKSTQNIFCVTLLAATTSGCTQLPELPVTPIYTSPTTTTSVNSPASEAIPTRTDVVQTKPNFDPQQTPQFPELQTTTLSPSQESGSDVFFAEQVSVSATPSASNGLSGSSGSSMCPAIVELQPLEGGGCTLTSEAQSAVTFLISSDSLTKRAFQVLDNLADAFSDNPNVRIEVDAHSDNRGDPAKNLELSKRRAEAVAQYLQRSGIAQDQIVSTAYAGEQPIASNDTINGRRKNRRVEFRFFP